MYRLKYCATVIPKSEITKAQLNTILLISRESETCRVEWPDRMEEKEHQI